MEANNNNNKPEDILQQLSEQDVNKLELQYIEGAEKTEVKNLSDAEAQQHAQKAYDNTLGAKSRIMLCGKSGVGKSSLVNFTFKKDKAKVGYGKPQTQITEMHEDDDGNVPVILYDMRGLEVNDKLYEKEVKDLIKSRNSSKDVLDHIHCVWYLISLAPNSRLEDYEFRIMKDALKDLPLIIILTMADVAPEGAEAEMKKRIEEQKIPNLKGIFTISTVGDGVIPQKKCPNPNCNSEDQPVYKKQTKKWLCTDCDHRWESQRVDDVDAIVQATLNELPEQCKIGFLSGVRAAGKLKLAAAISTIVVATAGSATIGASPIPFSDAALLVPAQIVMFVSIAGIFGFGIIVKKPTVIAVVAALQAAVSGGGVGIASALKLIPGVGTVVGGVINGFVASTLTAALGTIYTVMFYKLSLLGDPEKMSEDQLLAEIKKNVKPSNVMAVFKALARGKGGLKDRVEGAVNDSLKP